MDNSLETITEITEKTPPLSPKPKEKTLKEKIEDFEKLIEELLKYS